MSWEDFAMNWKWPLLIHNVPVPSFDIDIYRKTQAEGGVGDIKTWPLFTNGHQYFKPTKQLYVASLLAVMEKEDATENPQKRQETMKKKGWAQKLKKDTTYVEKDYGGFKVSY